METIKMTKHASNTPRRIEPILAGFARAGLSPSHGYRLIKSGDFPRQVKVGRQSYLVSTEVDGWLDARIAERDVEFGAVP
jgi:predicted DNA-binding transcriptional regulator AlpA